MTTHNKEYSLRYIGSRFNGARLPLDVLADLPALRDLIVALAKQEYRLKHPDKKRVPQGFDKSISFALLDIKDGSAIPVFALENQAAQQELPTFRNEMEAIVDRAYTRIAKLFDDASNHSYPEILPKDAIYALTKLGANIQDDEKIEFQGTAGTDGNVVILDMYRRKNILTHVRETYTIEFEDVGILMSADASQDTIKIETEKYGVLKLPLDGISMPVEQFGSNLLTLVEFSLSIALDAHDIFKKVEKVHSIDLVYNEDVTKCLLRLEELSQIEKGWLDGQGERLAHVAGTRATQLIFMRTNIVKLFRIFPTADGGISIEFDINDWNFAVEISHDGVLEIDGGSESGENYALKSFDNFSVEFFEAFDNMISEASNDKN